MTDQRTLKKIIADQRAVLSEIIEGLSSKLPLAEKIEQYDSETKESWVIEVPDQYKYSALFDWVDENLGRWRKIVPAKEVAKHEN
jgi:hypothetical protein